MATNISSAPTAERIKAHARALGFDAVGIARADAPWDAGARLEEFLSLGRQGDMDWMFSPSLSSPACGGSGSREARDEGGGGSPLSHAARDSSPASGGAKAAALNPVGTFRRDGEEALAAALGAYDLAALKALVVEHNLDPSGETAALDRDGLAAHVIAQAKRRAARDEKLFDY